MELRDLKNIARTTAAGLVVSTVIAISVETLRPDNQVEVVSQANAVQLQGMFRIQQPKDSDVYPPFIDLVQQQKDKEDKETKVFWATIAVGGLMGATVGHSWYHFGKPGARHSHSGSTNRQPICYNAK